MRLTEVRIKLCENAGSRDREASEDAPCGGPAGRLVAICALTFDNAFMIRNVKLIDGIDGLFLALPSRNLANHGGRWDEKIHLDPDVPHPIDAVSRSALKRKVIDAYHHEIERSNQPGYTPPSWEGEETEFFIERQTSSCLTEVRFDPEEPGAIRGFGVWVREAIGDLA